MKKKVLISFVLLAMVAASVIFAQQPTLDKLKFVGTNSGYGAWAANNNISGVVVIPATNDGKTVTEVDYFRNITGITSVIIPNSVIRIFSSSFPGCTNLTSVTFQGANFERVDDGAFPGDLAAKYKAGGAGTYTRSAGGAVWTKQGGGQVTPAQTAQTLNGVWERSGGRQITVSENTGVFSSFESNPGALTQDAISKGYYALGGQAWRNLTSTGNLTWSGLYLSTRFNTASPNVAVGQDWTNSTFTLSANGQTLTIKDNTGTETWTRSGYKLDGVWERTGGRQITISGNAGVFSSFEKNPSALTQDAISKGYYALGSQAWRNLTSTGNLTWSGLYLAARFNTASPNVAVGQDWTNSTFTLNANGQTLTIKDSTGTETWTRKR